MVSDNYNLPFSEYFYRVKSIWKAVFLYSNIVVASGVWVAYRSTSQLFNLHFAESLAAYLFFAVASLYNLHWMLIPSEEHRNPREHWLKKYVLLFLILLLLSSGFAFYFFLQLTTQQQLFLIPAMFTSMLYLSPKIPWKAFDFFRKNIRFKTTLLALTWIYTMDLLPFCLEDKKIEWVHLSYWFYRYALIYSVCFLFDYKDRHEDVKKGIQSFIYSLNESQAYRYVIGLLGLAAICNGVLFLWMNTTVVIFQFLPLVFLLLTLKFSLKTHSETWYYLVLDNMLFVVPWMVYYVLA
jgi:hypothetical protein